MHTAAWPRLKYLIKNWIDFHEIHIPQRIKPNDYDLPTAFLNAMMKFTFLFFVKYFRNYYMDFYGILYSYLWFPEDTSSSTRLRLTSAKLQRVHLNANNLYADILTMTMLACGCLAGIMITKTTIYQNISETIRWISLTFTAIICGSQRILTAL